MAFDAGVSVDISFAARAVATAAVAGCSENTGLVTGHVTSLPLCKRPAHRASLAAPPVAAAVSTKTARPGAIGSDFENVSSDSDDNSKHTGAHHQSTTSNQSTISHVRQCAPDLSSSSSVSPANSSSSCGDPPPPAFVGTMGAAEFVARASASLSLSLQKSSMNIVHSSSRSNKPCVAPLARAFDSGQVPLVALHVYVRRLVTHAGCSPSAFVTALVLVDRLQSSGLCLSELSVHRALAAALFVAVKLTDDRMHRARFYAVVAGLPCRQEILTLEHTLLSLLSFRVFVSADDYSNKLSQLAAIPLHHLPYSSF